MVLIIYAHPDPQSFNHAILETTTSLLRTNGKSFQVVDLYAVNFNPVMSAKEVKGALSEETKHYQQLIKKSTSIIFIFPVWWFRAPAILEGFCDKVFTPGFAYRFKKIIGIYGIPLPMLRDKTVRAFITHGAPALPVKTIYFNAVKYRFLLGFLSFSFYLFRCRIFQFWAVPFVSDKKRKSYLRKVSSVISKL
ncbi:MAG: NAD(P)H-dependent oxidoreductase [Bacteroidia bacterium]|nr:NAD(P)H-dependent oxidoreductase [Bacteroidia bacterium]